MNIKQISTHVDFFFLTIQFVEECDLSNLEFDGDLNIIWSIFFFKNPVFD